MSKPFNDVDHLKRGVAILATTLVETLNEGDPTFKDRFLKRLTEAYYHVRDDGDGNDPLQTLELLSWTRSFITGFSQISGQGEPFFRP